MLISEGPQLRHPLERLTKDVRTGDREAGILPLSTLQRYLRARRLATQAASGRPKIVAVGVTPRV
jgi:hypothetical protein